MKAVIQRVSRASVEVNQEITSKIDQGLVVLLGITHSDTTEDVDYLIKKIINMRIFEDDKQKMNLSLLDIKGSILSISQFTLYADTSKGRRPNFMEAARPEQAEELYDLFNMKLLSSNINVQTGVFGEMMDIELINSGPVTITINSK